MATKISTDPLDFAKDIEQFMDAVSTWPALMMQRSGKVMSQALIVLAGDASKYPDANPGSTYVRTGTLGRLWFHGTVKVSIRKHSMRGTIGNATSYGPYVQDPDLQASVHRGRWRTTKDVIDERRQDVLNMFERANVTVVNEVAKKGMGG